MKELTCPKCGGGDVRTQEKLTATIRVDGVYADGSIEYGATECDWDSSQTLKTMSGLVRFLCNDFDCQHEFTVPGVTG